jgi:8-oxo-dGTP pyrophosphatase MutT (NUDIX family)
MHRSSLRQLLDNYKPNDNAEIVSRDLMLDFVNGNPHCFERSSLKGHITGSAWLLNHDLSKVLLLHHAKLDLWCQLGGHCDGDADVLKVAIKEAQEESGINNILPVSSEIFDIDIHSVPVFGDVPAHFHYDVRFILRVRGDEEAVGNKESKALAWFGKDAALIPNKSESIMRMFRKWCSLSK